MLFRSASLAIVLLAAACSSETSTTAPLPPPGLAGAPKAPTAIDPNAAMPAGHPPIDGAHAMQGGGGDDGAPIPAKGGALPLPNLPGMEAAQPGGGGGGGGAGAGVVFTGMVLEKLDVPSYTYIRVQTTSGSEEWVAVSTMPVNVGDTVTVNQQMVMENFPSKSLNKTFARVVFGTAFVGG
jgi:hypothetical protein